MYNAAFSKNFRTNSMLLAKLLCLNDLLCIPNA
jgi:hypothetical protein